MIVHLSQGHNPRSRQPLATGNDGGATDTLPKSNPIDGLRKFFAAATPKTQRQPIHVGTPPPSESADDESVQEFAQDLGPAPPSTDAVVIPVAEENAMEMVDLGTGESGIPPYGVSTAATAGDVSALQYFINKAHDPVALVNKRDPSTACTLLHLAVSDNENPYQVMELLLRHGAESTARNVYNIQAIHLLPMHTPNPVQAIELLLEYNADPNACDGDQWTPLHYAARFCSAPLNTIKCLVKHGANINALDTQRRSPAFCLLANGDHAQVLDWLIHEGKMNLSVVAEFTDCKSRATLEGTLILQAVKYVRLECLLLLTHSPTAMDALRKVVTRHELDYCHKLITKLHQNAVKAAQSTAPTTTSSYGFRVEQVLQIVQDLIIALEADFQANEKSKHGLSWLTSSLHRKRRTRR